MWIKIPIPRIDKTPQPFLLFVICLFILKSLATTKTVFVNV